MRLIWWMLFKCTTPWLWRYSEEQFADLATWLLKIGIPLFDTTDRGRAYIEISDGTRRWYIDLVYVRNAIDQAITAAKLMAKSWRPGE